MMYMHTFFFFSFAEWRKSLDPDTTADIQVLQDWVSLRNTASAGYLTPAWNGQIMLYWVLKSQWTFSPMSDYSQLAKAIIPPHLPPPPANT
jgi:hypothetical protein